MKGSKLTHIDESGNPGMVDVSSKPVTRRVARAQAIVHVGKEIIEKVKANEIITKKGAVFQTAIVAGVMGAKKTSDLIPLTHPIGLEDCQIHISHDNETITIESEVTVASKTGVEMEALTAVSIAALTIYDMCKAMSHDIVVTGIKLLEKTGGKKDFKRNKNP